MLIYDWHKYGFGGFNFRGVCWIVLVCAVLSIQLNWAIQGILAAGRCVDYIAISARS